MEWDESKARETLCEGLEVLRECVGRMRSYLCDWELTEAQVKRIPRVLDDWLPIETAPKGS